MIAFCLGSTDHGTMILNRMDCARYPSGQLYGVGYQLLEFGNYEPDEVALLKRLVMLRRKHFGDGVIALDGGANIGVHTLELSKAMRQWGFVLAVEAQEKIFYALAGNIAINNCFNARAIWAALNRGEEVSFKEPDYTRAASFGSFSLKDAKDSPTLSVAGLRIDDLNLERLDLLKLDLEGMEQEALDGAKETIARCRPIMFIETLNWDFHAPDYVVRKIGINSLAIHTDDPCLKEWY